MSEENKPEFINARRRGLLQGAAVTGGVVASGGAIASEALNVVNEEVLTEPEPSKGYRRTEHVQRYYARARF